MQTSSSTDETAEPSATCSLQSQQGAKDDVHALVTLLVLDDEGSADTTYQSQCRTLDPSEVTRTSVTLQGADQSCGGRGKGADSAVLAALSGRHVVTVRFSSAPPGHPDALTKATSLAAAVLPQASSSSSG